MFLCVECIDALVRHKVEHGDFQFLFSTSKVVWLVYFACCSVESVLFLPAMQRGILLRPTLM